MLMYLLQGTCVLVRRFVDYPLTLHKNLDYVTSLTRSKTWRIQIPARLFIFFGLLAFSEGLRISSVSISSGTLRKSKFTFYLAPTKVCMAWNHYGGNLYTRKIFLLKLLVLEC
jgi:hypothetical protein